MMTREIQFVCTMIGFSILLQQLISESVKKL